MSQDVKDRLEPTGSQECGRAPATAALIAPLNEPVAAPTHRSVRVDEDGRIAEDLSCRSCGYNLRGLDRSAACPECFTGVDRSIRSDLLKFSDPAWVDRLSRGMKLIIIGVLAGVVTGIVVVGMGALLATGGLLPGLIVVIAELMGVAFSLITVVGTWLLTTPEAGRREPAARITVRRTARWCAIVQIALAPLQMAGMGTGGFGSIVAAMPPTVLLGIVWTLGMLLQVVVLVGQAAMLIYLRRLALRIPHPRLARHTRVVTWGYLSGQALAVVAGLAFFMLAPSWLTAGTPTGPTGRGVILTVGTLGCIVGITTLVFGVWGLVLLFQYRRAFSLAARGSRRTWEEAPESVVSLTTHAAAPVRRPRM